MQMKKIVVLLVAVAVLAGLGAAQGPSTDIAIEKIKTEPVPLQTSEYADIWLRVTNNGSTTADDVTVTFEPSFPFSVDPGERMSWDVGRLVPGGTYHIHLQVRVDENAVHGTNELEFRTETGGSSISITKSVPVEVRTDDAALVVSEVDFPAEIGPGATQTMTFTLANLADSALKNIDLTLDIGTAQPFGTGATTRKRVQAIGSGDTAQVAFDLQIDEGADNGVYRIPIDLEYENEAGTSFSRTESTGIVIGGDSQLEVAVDERTLMAAGRRGDVTLRVVNRGQGQANFVNMRIPSSDAYEVLSSRSIYLGDMEPDDYQTATLDMYAGGGADAVTLPVELAYKDASGQELTETRNVTVPLYSGDELSRFNEGGSGILPIIIVVLLAGGGYWYWKRRKNRGEPGQAG